MQKLKILILNYEYPPLGGGAGIISRYQAEKLAEFGHKVDVITCSEKNKFYIDDVNSNLRIIRLNAHRPYYFKSGIREKIDWILKAEKYTENLSENQYDFCLAHFSIPGGYVAEKLKKRISLKYAVISHAHDIPWFCIEEMFWYHLFSYPIIKKVCNNASLLFVQSNAMEVNAKNFLKNQQEKLVKIPNGSDAMSFFKPENKTKSDKIKIVFAGRLVKQKQPLFALEVAATLKKQNVNFELIFAGDGPLRKKIEYRIQKLNLNDCVTIKGWISKAEIVALYHQSDILLSTSQNEGMSIAILEALFSGLYVITTGVSGNPELIKHQINGEICMTDPSAFAKAIKYYISDVEENQERKEFYNNFIEKFEWTKLVKEYESAILNSLNDETL
ncbi:MAG: glycosyltransferase family 1 protein [Chitinophagaceae bacterium]|nr:MAG: glycosyltransferase family 1 protein [Chitinophagaceae bacterium]